jgi:hypothetical protein
LTKLSELKTFDELYPDLPPAHCEGCGGVIGDDLGHRPCRADYCIELFCECGRVFASFGPVGCPSCSPYRLPRIRRIRQAYRRRHH